MDIGENHFSIVIVGAGIHGLRCAHTFLQLDPDLKVLVVENKSSIGGVWADEQLYPTMRANNVQGFYEFSDFPMLGADVGVQKRGILTGKSMNAYIKRYAEHFDLLRLVRLNTKVVRATQRDQNPRQTWKLQLETGDIISEVTCSKLVVATGQTSWPLMPTIPGQQDFTHALFHSEQLGTKGTAIANDPTVKHVTVIGGSKSAHDAVYMFAKAGKQITWFMREDGRGGFPMANSSLRLGKKSIWLENTLWSRQLSWFGACPWGEGDGFGWIRSFLHRTSLGRWLVRNLFAQLGLTVAKQTGILDSEKSRRLAPTASLQWSGTQAAVLTYEDDFYKVIADDRIEIVKAQLDHLTANGLVIKEGTDEVPREIQTDAIVCATGYQYELSFPLEPQEKRLEWGMPVPTDQDDIYLALDLKADTELLRQFPELAHTPATFERQPGHTPWRLWRFIAPPSQVAGKGDRSLAFLCAITSYQTTIKCELTSLWTYAYLFNCLDVTPEFEGKVKYEAALWSRFGRFARPMGMQGKIADLLLDAMPYYDTLLRDLGLRSWRRRGFFQELFGGWYGVRDYRGVVDEWRELQDLRRTDGVKKLV